MTVLIEHVSNKLGREESIIAHALTMASRTYQSCALSQVERGRVDSSGSDLVVGSLSFIKAALRQRKIEMPQDNSYPLALVPYLKRNVWAEKLGQALDRAGHGRYCFTKPSVRTKRFTGVILADANDWRLGGVPRSEPVWSSDVVSWVTEWRIYVQYGRAVFKAHYGGSKDVEPDGKVIQDMIQAIKNDSLCPKSYALDVGVLDNGSTALVEMNDAFSIGAYDGIDGATYLEFLQSRWNDIVSS